MRRGMTLKSRADDLFPADIARPETTPELTEGERGGGGGGGGGWERGLYGGVRFIADFDCSKRAAVLLGLFAPQIRPTGRILRLARLGQQSVLQCCCDSLADTIGMLLMHPHFCPSRPLLEDEGRGATLACATLVLVARGRGQRRLTRDSSSDSFQCLPDVYLFSVERRVPARRWARSHDVVGLALRRGTQGDSSKIAAGKYVRAAT